MAEAPLTRYLETRALEVFFGVLMVVSGLTLLLPGDTFSLPQYIHVKMLVSENFGAVVFIVAGSARLAALGYNGRRRRSPLVRLVACMVGAAFWLSLSWAFFEAYFIDELSPPPLILGVAVTAFVFELYSGARCGTDASHLNSFGQRGSTSVRRVG